jgi:hypothetical protein
MASKQLGNPTNGANAMPYIFRLHWGRPRHEARISFTHHTYWFQDGDADPIQRRYDEPVQINHGLRRWFGVVLFNRVFIGVMQLAKPTRS